MALVLHGNQEILELNQKVSVLESSSVQEDEELLSSIGIKIVQNIPKFVLKHPQIRSYIFAPNYVADAIIRYQDDRPPGKQTRQWWTYRYAPLGLKAAID